MLVDPLAEKREWLFVYIYIQNNPVLRIDYDGALDSKEEAKEHDIKTGWFRNNKIEHLPIENSLRTKGNLAMFQLKSFINIENKK